MEREKISDNELTTIFKNGGWYQGRKEDIENELIGSFGEYPPKVYSFLEEFSGLKLENEIIVQDCIDGVIQPGKMKIEIFISGELSEEEIESYEYYSEIIKSQLYPIGSVEHALIGLDSDLNMYFFDITYGCYRISQSPVEGLKCILNNDLYSSTYCLIEWGEDKGKWVKRIK